MMIPRPGWQHWYARRLIEIAECWIASNNAITDLTQRIDWDVQGVEGPLLLLPLLAAGLLRSREWPTPVVAGLILLAAGPSGALANVYAYLAGANAALAVALYRCRIGLPLRRE